MKKDATQMVEMIKKLYPGANITIIDRTVNETIQTEQSFTQAEFDMIIDAEQIVKNDVKDISDVVIRPMTNAHNVPWFKVTVTAIDDSIVFSEPVYCATKSGKDLASIIVDLYGTAVRRGIEDKFEKLLYGINNDLRLFEIDVFVTDNLTTIVRLHRAGFKSRNFEYTTTSIDTITAALIYEVLKWVNGMK